MALGDISKKLYDKKDQLEERKLDKDVYDGSKIDQAENHLKTVEAEIVKSQGKRETSEEQTELQKRKMFVFGGIFLVILLAIFGVVFLYFKFVGSAFLEEKVEISIYGADEVRSAEDVVYVIRVENFNRVALKNVKISLNYSESLVIQERPYIQKEGFKSSKITIGDVKAREKKEYEVVFKPFGPRDRQAFLNSAVAYQPANFNSIFEKSAQKSVVIKSSPISITLIPVKTAASGEKVRLDVIVKNDSELEFSNLELKLDYPEGFTFETSDLAPSRDKHVWQIDKISGKEQIKIGIEGIIEGMPESLKTFKAEFGQIRNDDEMLVFTENEGVMKMISNRVEIKQEVFDENLYAGGIVKFNTKFKNTSDVPLRDLILVQHLDSRVILKEEVLVPQGFYDSEKNTIIWKASQVPALKLLMPGEESSVESFIPIIAEIPMNNENDKNFFVNAYTEIESLDVDSPLWENKKIRSALKKVPVNSKLIMEVEAKHISSELPNFGPTPLRVGEETTFTIYLKLKNTSNDLKNLLLTMKLPSGIVWKNQYVPKDAGMEFNTRTNEMKLVVGSVEAGTGFISPTKTYAFQVGVVPSANQISSQVYLLNDLKITAIDTFTQNEVSYNFKELEIANVRDADIRVLDPKLVDKD
jgi:hypothetical protein